MGRRHDPQYLSLLYRLITGRAFGFLPPPSSNGPFYLSIISYREGYGPLPSLRDSYLVMAMLAQIVHVMCTHLLVFITFFCFGSNASLPQASVFWVSVLPHLRALAFRTSRFNQRFLAIESV